MMLTTIRKWFGRKRYLVVLLFIVFKGAARAQFIDLRADLETTFWSWKDEDDPPRVASKSWKVHCVVSTNEWVIGIANSGQEEESWRFTGTNLVWCRQKQGARGPEIKDGARVKQQPEERSFTFDGNVEGGKDRAFLPVPVKVAWLAFCSGPFLKRSGREVPMPSDLWKETWLYHDHLSALNGFKDETVLFPDELALPRSLDVLARNGQPLFQYRAAHRAGPSALSTNVAGWEFPLEFQAVQYLPQTTNTWQVYFSARGKITAIGDLKANSFSEALAERKESNP